MHQLAPRLLLLLALALPLAAARADEYWRTTLLEENDSLYFHSDKHYTQGLRFSFLSPSLDDKSWAGELYDLAGAIPTVFGTAAHQRRVSLFFGQSIFTPKNLAIRPPDPTDRPYGGWLYVGASFLQETGRQLENLELDAGIVGPGALGRQTQNDFHQFIGVHQAQGWSGQIQNEPGLVLSYERLWRVPAISLTGADQRVVNGLDIVPQLGGSLGNVFTYGEAGALVRVGRHLEVDYGPARIRPALSGTDYFNRDALDDELGFYLFAGAQGRAVGRNMFLDGNSFRASPSVQRKTLVGDYQAGLSLFWSSRLRLDVSAMRRTPEFVGQRHLDETGTAAVSFSW